MTLILYPDVPDVFGVPPLNRDALTANLPSPIARRFDGPFLPVITGRTQWGIFSQSGIPVLVGDSVVAVEFQKEYAVSDYPVEQGGFQSYNKVERPFEARVTFTQGGTDSDRAAFLALTADVCDSTDLFVVVTPEIDYPSASAIRYSYRRTSEKGATLLTVEVTVEQIRVTATAAFTNTKTPEGAATQNTGAVQAVPPTAMQAATIGAP